MDLVLSKTQAHRFFGKLYRKVRPPEEQKKVDQIVKDNSDIFVRIKLIEEVDEKHKAKVAVQKKARSYANMSQRAVASQKDKATEQLLGIPGIETPIKAQDSLDFPKKQKKSIGFFERIFGGRQRRISAWGASSGTLVNSFLNIELSPSAKNIFSGLIEKDIVKAIKAFRLSAGGIWDRVDAATYNTLIAAYQFFSEYIKFQNLFSRANEPQEWIHETLAMQKHYAHLIQYFNYHETLTQVLPLYMGNSEKYTGLAQGPKTACSILSCLSSTDPLLKIRSSPFMFGREARLYMEGY